MKKILVIDHDEDVITVLTDVLKQIGHEVVVANDGIVGAKMVKTEQPDLILLDLAMTGMDGYEVCHSIRLDRDKAIAEPKLIVMSANSYPDLEIIKKAGADMFLSKPFGIKELQCAIAEFLGPAPSKIEYDPKIFIDSQLTPQNSPQSQPPIPEKPPTYKPRSKTKSKPRKPIAKKPKQKDILLLSAEPQLSRVVIKCLPHQSVTVVESPIDVPHMLSQQRFALVITTNCGVNPWKAVSVIPRHHDYPVFFLTGHMDDALEQECRTKGIKWQLLPFDFPSLFRELKLALDVHVL